MKGEFEGFSGGPRERLLAEVQSAVQSAHRAIDRAAGRKAEAAEADRRSERAVARIESLLGERIDPLRREASELAVRANELDREVGRLSSEVKELASAIRPAAAPEPEPPRPRFSRGERPSEDPVAAGVRLVVDQMRLAGESEASIVKRLEAMGVENPDAVLMRLWSPS